MLQVQVTLDTAAMFMAVILITLIGMACCMGSCSASNACWSFGTHGSEDAVDNGRAVHPSCRRPKSLSYRRKGVSGGFRSDLRRRGRANLSLWSAHPVAARQHLLKIIAGLHPYEAGEVKIGTDQAQPFDPSRDIGMVFQQPLLLKWRRIIDNVLLPAEILGCRAAASRERAAICLRWSVCPATRTNTRTNFPAACSNAPRSPRALVHDPKLILMDEPFGALDALTREKMNLELLRIWQESRKTIVFVNARDHRRRCFSARAVIVLTAGPARMADNFSVELPHPRTLDMKTHEKFGDYTRRIYHLLGMH